MPLLGAQVNARSSIIITGGTAKEAEFLLLIEDAIRQTGLAQRVQRYQLAAIRRKSHLMLQCTLASCYCWCP